MDSALEYSNVIICDDHPVSALGVEMLLRNFLSKSLQVQFAHTGKKALELIKKRDPDLTIMDLDLPDMDGRDVIRTIRESSPRSRIIVLTGSGDSHVLRQVYNLNVQGILRKTGTSLSLSEALQSAKNLNNKTYLDLSVSQILKSSEDSALTPREYEVLELMSKGYKSEDIAKKMKCSVTTVKTYRARVMNKSGVRNSAEMMAWFLKGNRDSDFGADS